MNPGIKLIKNLFDELECARSDLTSEAMRDPDKALVIYKKAIASYLISEVIL